MPPDQYSAPEVKTLMTGLVFVESPRWHDGRLWFSDWGTQEIIAVDEHGASEVVVRIPAAGGAGQPGIRPACIDWIPDGRLLIVAGRDRLLLRREPDGSIVTHADLKRLSDTTWNDIVVDGRGNAYVGNTGFDFPDGAFATGIIAVVGADGAARQVAEGVSFVNGMAVTADNSTLVVAESYAKRLTAFDIASDGSLSKGRLWADLNDGYPDGICIDADNAVWYGDVPNKRCVRVHEGGEVLQTINLDRGCFACALGGADRRTLFLLAADWRGPSTLDARSGQVLAVEAPVAGAGWP